MSATFSTHVMSPTVGHIRAENAGFTDHLVVFVRLVDDDTTDVTISGTPDELRAFADDLHDRLDRLQDVDQ